MKSKSHENMLDKRALKIDPWGTPNKFFPMTCMLDLCGFLFSISQIVLKQS